MGQPGWAAMVSCILVVGVIVLPLAGVTLAVIAEAQGTGDYLKHHADGLIDPNLPAIRYLREHNVDVPAMLSVSSLVDRFQSAWGEIASRTAGVVGNVVVIVFKVIFIVLTMYYLFRDGERIQAALQEGLPLERCSRGGSSIGPRKSSAPASTAC